MGDLPKEHISGVAETSPFSLSLHPTWRSAFSRLLIFMSKLQTWRKRGGGFGNRETE